MQEINEYERQRQLNIKRNQELLKKLELGNILKKKINIEANSTKKRTSDKKKERKKDYSTFPRRNSSRLLGLSLKLDLINNKSEETNLKKETQQTKRVHGDLKLSEIIEKSYDWEDAKKVIQDVTYCTLKSYEKNESTEIIDKDIAQLKQKMQSLELYKKWDPQHLKVVPERISSLTIHPNITKKIVFAGDKVGNMGIWDMDGSKTNKIKNEDEEEALEEPLIHHYKLHSGSISSLKFNPFSTNILYSSSYDGIVRALHLDKELSTEIYVQQNNSLNVMPLISALTVHPKGDQIYLTTTDGQFIMKDLNSQNVTSYQLHDKKIGGLSVHPSSPYLICTASLDRTMKIWDLRTINNSKKPIPLGVYTSRLSVSSAFWNSEGSIIATSYDDTVTIFDNPNYKLWNVNTSLDDLSPTYTIKHNNQTGRWVTILRAQWHENPSSGIQKFTIGNMQRYIDIYSSKGIYLSCLGDSEKITAVPAVCQFHPTQDWVVGGSASGKIVAYLPPEEQSLT
ncbi:unnamed protein product [Pneumocystis jirovecii]|uniref:DNA damage-binding protein CMR1 n=2 Tax=Pneumocystis jirovecii TaxID=42068 RepID=L0P9W5_PNEJI|nr:uncharacterized protein T551_02358 [Pneumocystis jirovecii RU7]KTW29084.1 hypothetical protein T551_02358 [Pneumocystis jirovecii RU7]CCJ29206.1 unnamed protein product [Pneumocystis jirovecii]